MKLTAQEVYNKLLEENIYNFSGNINFDFGGISVKVCQKDVVGNVLQEWLQKWLDHQDIDYALNDNPQMPPDFYLDPDSREHDMLEVKAFNYEATPGFDIADFKMYAKEILNHPYMLDVDYLIFGYVMDNTGIVSVKQIWLKKVWEITRRADKYPLFIQAKDQQIHKIRPAVWYRDNHVDFTVFSTKEDFISAIDETMHNARDQMGDKINTLTWRNDFMSKYRQYYDHDIIIPRWDDIADKYDTRIVRAREKAAAERDKAQKSVEKAKARLLQWENKSSTAHTEKQKLTAKNGGD